MNWLNRRNIPNLLTYGRIAAIPVFILFFYLPDSIGAILSFVVFVAASITDWLDGYFARKYNVTSDVGRFMDPTADKLLVVTALVLLAVDGRAATLAVILIIGREVWVSGLREFLGQHHVAVPVSTLAKWKTATQMVAIPLLLLGGAGFEKITLLGTFTLWLACVLTLVTGYRYTKAAWPHLQDKQAD